MTDDATLAPRTPPPSLLSRFGPAARPDRAPAHPRPEGMADDLVEALGTLSKAMETLENARGHLYAFHQLSGTVDLTLQDAVRELREAGAGSLADDLEQTLVGRDVIADRWTFQLVEDYDAHYYTPFRAAEEHARTVCGQAEPHILEAEMKHREQQH